MHFLSFLLLPSLIALANFAEAKSNLYCGGWIEWKASPEFVPAEQSASGKEFHSNSADLFFQDATKKDIDRCIESDAHVDTIIAYSDDSGWAMPLHYLAAQGNVEATIALIKAGANIDARNYLGETPLHKAAAYNYSGVIVQLVKAGADIDAQDDYGHTPLHDGALNDSAVAVKVLIALGANPNIKNGSGMFPIDIAKEEEAELVSDVLIGAKISPNN